MNRARTCRIAALTFIILLSGCASKQTSWERLYLRLSEDPGKADATVLTGRKIVIDPGHGGYFEGATGIDSLTEAEVNLGVALYLWGLLNDAGVDVVMTRTNDRDFLPDSSLALGDDLAERTRVANSFDPDVFLSIHHNSNISLDRKKNSIEVYYRATDPDASMELATDIQTHLSRNLGIEGSSIKPGSYYVLRNSLARASVLGEASYISHPGIEKKLRISSKQRLEAEAYFLGLISYFSRGIPVISPVDLPGDTIGRPEIISFTVAPGASIPVDPSSVGILDNGRRVPAVWDPLLGRISYALPYDAPNGKYRFQAYARSILGGSCLSTPFEILLTRPARHIIALPFENSAGPYLSLSVKILDQFGEPVADGQPLKVTLTGSGKVLKGRSKKGVFRFRSARSSLDQGLIFEVPGLCDTLFFTPGDDRMTLSLIVTDRASGKDIDDAAAFFPDGTLCAAGAAGVLSIPASLSASPITITAPGYRRVELDEIAPAGDTGRTVVILEPLLGGIFHGKKIVIDPAGGGTEDSGLGPMRLRGATVNLDIAKQMRDILTTAGAEIILTREGEESLSLDDRIERTNRFRGDLALGLYFGSELPAGSDEPLFLHYPGSEKGSRIAGSLKEMSGNIPPFKNPLISESSHLFLQQTNLPACEIHAALNGETEKIFSSQLWRQMQANSIVTGLARFFAPDPTIFHSHDITISRSGSPVRGAIVSVDGLFTSMTDDNGVVSYGLLDEGSHILSIILPGNEKMILRHLQLPGATEGNSMIDVDL
ncbi:MAG: N-acetylmuramoyl-L-alanine amidase [Candidatus Krumholzibacteriota bacterium]|nr:N-acetylmuramoyl-L-alanine amidase [Candidatus Krumholzibacteriota bacterium]